jgi:hypothetical protein
MIRHRQSIINPAISTYKKTGLVATSKSTPFTLHVYMFAYYYLIRIMNSATDKLEQLKHGFAMMD